MVTDGLTPPVIVGAVPSKASAVDKVPVIVPVPVTASDSVAVAPLQIVVLPLRTAVGRWFTVTVAPPVLSAAMEGQVPLVKVAIV